VREGKASGQLELMRITDITTKQEVLLHQAVDGKLAQDLQQVKFISLGRS
jgi:hypothetical protein